MDNSEKSTILIVDDQPEYIKLLIMALEHVKFRILVAKSGEEALNLVKYAVPDLILLDVIMPDMDGFEICRRLKADETTRNIPVIFMTALSDTVDKVEGFDVGAVDYLTKPTQPNEVIARVKTHLTNHKLQRQLQEEKARWQALSEATFEGILIHNEGHILEVNRALEEIFGYHRAEVLHKNIVEFVKPEFHNVVITHMHEKTVYPYEVQGKRKDGSSVSLEIQARTIPYQGRDVKVVAVRDLSWRKVMEEEKASLQRENITLRSTIKDRYKFGDIIGKSLVMQEVYEGIVSAAASDANVLIVGESGTGKELVARTIHQRSTRQQHAFVAVNCGAVPESLFEREFFGHRRGAFTGADRDQPGYFDRADQGTLFLDEVSELTPSLQVKLLRVLEDKAYIPVGDTISKTAAVRIIAATNSDLRVLLHQGLIREDFFYRIRVMVISLPPLRDRKEDIPLLIEHFLAQYGEASKGSSIPTQVVQTLSMYDWPGNVRELQNELQRYLAEQRLEFIGNTTYKAPGTTEGIPSNPQPEGQGFYQAVEAFEKQLILNALQQNLGHREKSAAMLKILPRTLHRKMKKYELL
jgi:PAS domain S-box-containing protein